MAKKDMGKYLGLGLLAVIVLSVMGVQLFYLYPSLGSTFDRFWAQADGIYGHILEKESTTQGVLYSVMAFKVMSSQAAGFDFPAPVNVFDSGNGICGIKSCDLTDNQGHPIYIIQAGAACAGLNNYKLVNFANTPTGEYFARLDFSAPIESVNAEWTYTQAASQACSSLVSGQVYIINVHETFSGGSTVCGDEVCEGSETTSNCPADCAVVPVCGDGMCDASENTASCPSDCPATQVCGDGTCSGTETASSCAVDCAVQPVCGDGTCNGQETASTCASDCSNPATDNTLIYVVAIIAVGAGIIFFVKKR